MAEGRLPGSPELLVALKEVDKEAAKLIKLINESNNDSFRSGVIYDFASKIFKKGYDFNKQ